MNYKLMTRWILWTPIPTSFIYLACGMPIILVVSTGIVA